MGVEREGGRESRREMREAEMQIQGEMGINGSIPGIKKKLMMTHTHL